MRNYVEDQLIDAIDRRWGNTEGGELPAVFANLFKAPQRRPRRIVVANGVARVIAPAGE